MRNRRFESPAAYMRRRCITRLLAPARSDVFGAVKVGTVLDNQREAELRYLRVLGCPHTSGELRTRTVNGFPM